jgi:hypothetical protein
MRSQPFSGRPGWNPTKLPAARLLMYAAEGAVILARAQRSIEPLVFTAEQLSTRPVE